MKEATALRKRFRRRPERRNIDPPASSYAIMRRARPTAERTVGPARMIAESLTPKPGIREQNLQSPSASGSGGRPDDDHVDLAGAHVVEEPPQGRPVGVAARETPVPVFGS